jgi:hypothetical protein
VEVIIEEVIVEESVLAKIREKFKLVNPVLFVVVLTVGRTWTAVRLRWPQRGTGINSG